MNSSMVFTAEQFQEHQEQLALMQKQQLEQIQQQASDVSNNTQSLGSTSNMLDSASAQFAASALVTSDQLLTLKVKEDSVVGGGVNGILQASGVYKGLQHSTTSATMLTSSSQVTMTSAPASIPASNSTNSTTTSIHNPHNSLSNHGNSTANSAPQLLIGNNLRLSVATPQIASLNSRHLPRSLGGMPPAALKLAAAASNCQLPKVATGENHEQEKQSLNSIAENTVAMEVT